MHLSPLLYTRACVLILITINTSIQSCTHSISKVVVPSTQTEDEVTRLTHVDVVSNLTEQEGEALKNTRHRLEHNKYINIYCERKKRNKSFIRCLKLQCKMHGFAYLSCP